MAFLSEELLSTIHSRASQHDADNTFPFDDLEDLKAAGYLSAYVPTEFGGGGLNLEEIAAEQTRLALDALAPVPASRYKDALHNLAEESLKRTH